MTCLFMGRRGGSARGRGSELRVALAVLCAGLLAGIPAARAELSKEELCAEVAKATVRERETLWKSLRDGADKALCRRDSVKAKPAELAGCAAIGVAKMASMFIKNVLDTGLKDLDVAEWKKWGPRGLSEDWEEGTIQVGFKRIFLGAAMAYATATVEVIKEGGKAEGVVTVCELDYQGRLVASHRSRFPAGTGNEGAARRLRVKTSDNRMLAVVVDTPATSDAFEYRARLWNRPNRQPSGPLDPKKGPYIADLHVHQFANLAFGGRLYWGQHAGAPDVALAKEVVTSPSAQGIESWDDFVKELKKLNFAIDANVVARLFKPQTTDEGYFSVDGEGGHPGYEDWPHHADRSHQQVYIDWLNHARKRGLKLVVVSIVHNDFLCALMSILDPFGNVPLLKGGNSVEGKWASGAWGCGDDESIRRQFAAIHKLQAEHSWYRVASHPWHARRIIEDDDLAVVISLETDKPLVGANGTYTNGWRDQLDQYQALGLSTLQMVHESNSIFAGAALHRNDMEDLQRFHWPLTELSDKDSAAFEVDDDCHNREDLTPEGKALVNEMIDRSMPIDLAHMSLRARKELFSHVTSKYPDGGYGLYDSHAKFERLLKRCDPEEKCSEGKGKERRCAGNREQEFVIPDELIAAYKKHRVVVGLRTASIDVKNPPNGAEVPNTCPGSARSFAQQVQYAFDNKIAIAFGTDFNTGVSQLGPRFGKCETGACWAGSDKVDERWRSDVCQPDEDKDRVRKLETVAKRNYYDHGLAHIGLLPDLANDLTDLKTPGAEELLNSAETFLDMWERAYPPDAEMEPESSVNPTKSLGTSCKDGDECASGKCAAPAGGKARCVCNEDKDCEKDQFCNMGADVKVNACERKRDDDELCTVDDGGRACKSGKCKLTRCYTPDSVEMGDTCYFDDACRKGHCSSTPGVKGECVCKKDSDCKSSQWCDAGADLHKNRCLRKLDKGEECGKAGDVGVGHRCKSGECKVFGAKVGKLECQ